MSEVGNRKLKVGIDLGTSRTAIMSERGEKAIFPSVVGYPRDLIGTKLLNGTKAIGEDAIERRTYLDIYYPLEGGVIKEGSEIDLEAASDLLAYTISQINPKASDEICAVIGVPARASFSNKEALLSLAKEVTEVALVVSEPFMVAYGMDRLTKAIVIDIGAGTTDICVLKGTVPNSEDQVTIARGGDHIDNVLSTLLLERYPNVQVTKHLVQGIKEQHSYVGESNDSALVTFRVGGKPTQYDVSKEIKTACETLISPIIEQVEYLLQGVDPSDQEETLKNIILAGGGSQIKGLDKALKDALADYGEINVVCVDDPAFAGCKGALKIAIDLPVAHWNQLGDVIGS